MYWHPTQTTLFQDSDPLVGKWVPLFLKSGSASVNIQIFNNNLHEKNLKWVNYQNVKLSCNWCWSLSGNWQLICNIFRQSIHFNTRQQIRNGTKGKLTVALVFKQNFNEKLKTLFSVVNISRNFHLKNFRRNKRDKQKSLYI